jgi:cold shock CspA family protein
MAHGVVKFYNEKGFGFIRRSGENDLFFHISEVRSLDEDLERDVPKIGDAVEYEIGISDRSNKLAAVNVHIRREQ